MAKKTFPWILMICLTAAISVLIGLGTWQLQRLAWKQNLISNLDTAYAQKADSFDTNKEYKAFDKIRLQGTWIEKDLFIKSKTYHEKIGYHLISPLETDQGIVFVNRGWVKDTASYPHANSTFDAVLRASQKSNVFIPNNDLENDAFYWEEIATLETAFNTKTVLPFIAWQIPEDAKITEMPYPVGEQPQLNNDHLQYALFWFALALALFVIGLMKAHGLKR
jgi:surfeit locus 1 family protein